MSNAAVLVQIRPSLVSGTATLIDTSVTHPGFIVLVQKMEKLYVLSESEFTSIQTKLEEVLNFVRVHGNRGIDGWIPESEIKKMLDIKTTTLWQMRTEGKITYSKINGKNYYLRKGIKKIRETNRVDAYR